MNKKLFKHVKKKKKLKNLQENLNLKFTRSIYFLKEVNIPITTQ